MSVLVLSHDDVAELLPMAECIELMAEALAALARGQMHQPLRSVVRTTASPGLLALMPAHRAAPTPLWALKAVCVFPENPARGLDAHQGVVVLFDGETGEVRALVNASAITAIRTAAVSAVATRVLAREDAAVLAILGAGVQGRAHLAAMAHARPFARARVWSRTLAHAEALAAEAGDLVPFPVEAAGSPEAAVREADVVVTATASPEPLLELAWLAPGTHVNAVGSSIPTARELDTETMAAATVFVDRRESTVSEAGDYLFPLHEGAIGPEHIRAELGEVLTGRAPGRSAAGELTVFKSLGLAVEDLAAAEYAYLRARERGAGSEAEL